MTEVPLGVVNQMINIPDSRHASTFPLTLQKVPRETDRHMNLKHIFIGLPSFSDFLLSLLWLYFVYSHELLCAEMSV